MTARCSLLSSSHKASAAGLENLPESQAAALGTLPYMRGIFASSMSKETSREAAVREYKDMVAKLEAEEKLQSVTPSEEA